MKRGILLVVMLLAVGGCVTPRRQLVVESEPLGAYIDMADTDEGPWTDYRRDYQKEEGQNVTPSVSKVKVGDYFWLQLRKKGYLPSDPEFVRVTKGPKKVPIPVKTKLFPPPPGAVLLDVYSEPPGAAVLVSERIDGDFAPWADAIGPPVTPAKGKVDVSDSFYMICRKNGYNDSIIEHVFIDSPDPPPLNFKLDPLAQERLTVTSKPSEATVLVAAEEHGRYEPWPTEGGQLPYLTPLDVMVDVGEAFWLKLRKDQYETTEPVLIRIEEGKPVSLQYALMPWQGPEGGTPQPPGEDDQGGRREGGQACDGVEAHGYAVIERSPAEARDAAILDALGAAVLQEYGGTVEAEAVAENYLLLKNRIVSLAKGRFTAYDVLQESQTGGLYRVSLCVRFQEGFEQALAGLNVSYLIGAREVIVEDGVELESDVAQRALADALMGVDSSLRVVLADEAPESRRDVAELARHENTDVALFIVVSCRLSNQLGRFYSFRTRLDYEAVTPETADVIATGRLEGVNKRRRTDKADAAVASMRGVSEAVAREILDKLGSRQRRAASHRVFVFGDLDQRGREALVRELGGIEGVRDARLRAVQDCELEGEATQLCEVDLTVSLGSAPGLSSKVQRLRDIDLDVIEADPYATVAVLR